MFLFQPPTPFNLECLRAVVLFFLLLLAGFSIPAAEEYFEVPKK